MLGDVMSESFFKVSLGKICAGGSKGDLCLMELGEACVVPELNPYNNCPKIPGDFLICPAGLVFSFWL